METVEKPTNDNKAEYTIDEIGNIIMESHGKYIFYILDDIDVPKKDRIDRELEMKRYNSSKPYIKKLLKTIQTIIKI
jgi:hypothetical protein